MYKTVIEIDGKVLDPSTQTEVNLNPNKPLISGDETRSVSVKQTYQGITMFGTAEDITNRLIAQSAANQTPTTPDTSSTGPGCN